MPIGTNSPIYNEYGVDLPFLLLKVDSLVVWKPISQHIELSTTIPVLRDTFPTVVAEPLFHHEALRKLVYVILSAPNDTISSIYNGLRSTPQTKFGSTGSYTPSLLCRLGSQYGDSDHSILVALLTMNFLSLQRGYAVYVPVDETHACLSGDIVECRARSDNVLDAGFCPRQTRLDRKLHDGT